MSYAVSKDNPADDVDYIMNVAYLMLGNRMPSILTNALKCSVAPIVDILIHEKYYINGVTMLHHHRLRVNELGHVPIVDLNNMVNYNIRSVNGDMKQNRFASKS